MAAKISDFIKRVRERGLLRSNRYDVVIPFPTTNDTDVMQTATLFCDSVSLPGINISSTPARVFGESTEMPYERTFEPVQLSFYCDTNLIIKQAFESWVDLIVNPQTRAINYYNNYIKDIEIYVQTVDEQSVQVIKLHDAYPKTIQSIQMDAGSRELMKMNVTLQYKYWTTNFTKSIVSGNNLRFDNTKPNISYSSSTPPSVVYDTSTPAKPFSWFDF